MNDEFERKKAEGKNVLLLQGYINKGDEPLKNSN